MCCFHRRLFFFFSFFSFFYFFYFFFFFSFFFFFFFKHFSTDYSDSKQVLFNTFLTCLLRAKPTSSDDVFILHFSRFLPNIVRHFFCTFLKTAISIVNRPIDVGRNKKKKKKSLSTVFKSTQDTHNSRNRFIVRFRSGPKSFVSLFFWCRLSLLGVVRTLSDWRHSFSDRLTASPPV